MSKFIANLLGVSVPDFDRLVQRLEIYTGYDGADIKLKTKIITGARQKIRALGLDPEDSTVQEVYFALLQKVRADDASLRESLDISPLLPAKGDNTEDLTKKAALSCVVIGNHLNPLLQKEKVLCLKTSTVKRILKSIPPKKTLKMLGLRSAGSVLRSNDPRTLYALASQIESESWNSQVAAQLRRLQAKDIHESSPEIISLPLDWTLRLSEVEFKKLFIANSELGSIVVLPSLSILSSGATLLSCAVLLQAAQKLSVESLPYRIDSLSSGVSRVIPEISSGQIRALQPVYGLNPNWPAVYQLLSEGSFQTSEYEFILQDLDWESVETKLASLSPDLDFWVDSHYLALPNQDLPVSFHLVDVAASAVMEREFGQQFVAHLRASLWNEFQISYLRYGALQSQIVKQLL